MVAEMANIPRKQAKTINLGMMYGMGVNKLSDQLDIDVDEAKGLVGQYHDRVPFVKGLMNGVMNTSTAGARAARSAPYWAASVGSISGSRRPLPCTRPCRIKML